MNTRSRMAYMPLATYPEAIADDAIRAAVGWAGPLGGALQVTTFAVDLPTATSGLGGMLIDVPGLVQAVEQQSAAECQRLETLVRSAAAAGVRLHCATRKLGWGAVFVAAAGEARHFDLSLLPWSATMAAQDLAQAVIFDSGRPALLVPPASRAAAIDHLAIAWDGSRVAARALGDALPLLAADGRVSVLTVRDEKALGGADPASALTAALVQRGYNATPVGIAAAGRPVAEVLQETALSQGAQLLAMGGFGHSRLRDFFLGGATRGILEQLRLPVLLSH